MFYAVVAIVCVVNLSTVLSENSNTALSAVSSDSATTTVLRGAAAAMLDDRIFDQKKTDPKETTLASIIVPSEKAQTFIKKELLRTNRRRLFYYFSVYGASGGCREEWSEGWSCEEREECFDGGNLVCSGNYYRKGNGHCSCTAKRGCTSSQFQTSAGSAYSDRTCTGCTVCGEGQRVTKSCGGTSNTVCGMCKFFTRNTIPNDAKLGIHLFVWFFFLYLTLFFFFFAQAPSVHLGSGDLQTASLPVDAKTAAQK